MFYSMHIHWVELSQADNYWKGLKSKRQKADYLSPGAWELLDGQCCQLGKVGVLRWMLVRVESESKVAYCH